MSQHKHNHKQLILQNL